MALDTHIGKRVHLHTATLGKAILRRPESAVDDLSDRHGLPAVTERTITDEDERRPNSRRSASAATRSPTRNACSACAVSGERRRPNGQRSARRALSTNRRCHPPTTFVASSTVRADSRVRGRIVTLSPNTISAFPSHFVRPERTDADTAAIRTENPSYGASRYEMDDRNSRFTPVHP
ncbi:hypothetical protein [Halopiger thermotolerans]